VLAERTRIERVIGNLLGNAVKYSPEGGRIGVTTAQATPWALVRVEDEGIGIPAQDVPKLFTPFYRATNVTARHFPGLGLGLYLARQIVEAHGGTLTVEDRGGAGSRFTVALPLSTQLDHAERAPSAAASNPS
jgi:signal transduction histidine kinase